MADYRITSEELDRLMLEVDSTVDRLRRTSDLYRRQNRKKTGQLRERLVAYFKENPHVSVSDIEDLELRRALYVVYDGDVSRVRREASILGTYDSELHPYVTGGEAGRLLGISRERVSQLFAAGKIDGYKVGQQGKRSILFIAVSSIMKREGKK